MSTIVYESTEYLSGREVATAYRDLIARCAKAHAGCYDDEQELVSSVVLGLLKYPNRIEYPEQFVRVMVRNTAINRTRAGAGSWEIVASEISDDDETDGQSLINDQTDASAPVEHILRKDTLIRLENMLSPAESRCYSLLKAGFEQEDLPAHLGVTRQAVSKIMKEIRKKFLLADLTEEAA